MLRSPRHDQAIDPGALCPQCTLNGSSFNHALLEWRDPVAPFPRRQRRRYGRIQSGHPTGSTRRTSSRIRLPRGPREQAKPKSGRGARLWCALGSCSSSGYPPSPGTHPAATTQRPLTNPRCRPDRRTRDEDENCTVTSAPPITRTGHHRSTTGRTDRAPPQLHRTTRAPALGSSRGGMRSGLPAPGASLARLARQARRVARGSGPTLGPRLRLSVSLECRRNGDRGARCPMPHSEGERLPRRVRGV
jgi:hypothetical protein